jgi:hypothetical protein
VRSAQGATRSAVAQDLWGCDLRCLYVPCHAHYPRCSGQFWFQGFVFRSPLVVAGRFMVPWSVSSSCVGRFAWSAYLGRLVSAVGGRRARGVRVREERSALYSQDVASSQGVTWCGASSFVGLYQLAYKRCWYWSGRHRQGPEQRQCLYCIYIYQHRARARVQMGGGRR